MKYLYLTHNPPPTVSNLPNTNQQMDEDENKMVHEVDLGLRPKLFSSVTARDQNRAKLSAEATTMTQICMPTLLFISVEC